MQMIYEILIAYSPSELKSVVNERMSKGWKLVGGVTLTQRGDGWVCFAQAMLNPAKE